MAYLHLCDVNVAEWERTVLLGEHELPFHTKSVSATAANAIKWKAEEKDYQNIS